MNAEKVAEEIQLYVFDIVFPASLFKITVNKIYPIICPVQLLIYAYKHHFLKPKIGNTATNILLPVCI